MAVITGTFNSLVSGTITGVFQNTAGGVLSGVIGTPGPAGPAGAAGPAGPQGEPGQGVPAGGLASQVLAKIDGQDFNTEWVDQSGAVVWGDIGGEISNQGDLVSALADKLDITTAAATYYLQTNPNGFITVSALTGYATQSWVTAGFYPLSGNPSGFLTASALTPYLSKAGNLSGLTSLSTARDNLNLGTSNTPVFAGLTAQGSAGNIAQLTPTSLTLTQAGSGIFTIQPSQGIVFPDATVQTTAYPGPVGATQWGSIGGSLINQTDLYNSLAAKLDSTTAASTYAVIAAGQPAGGTTGQVLTKNSGTNYDSSWATLIPGDRYLTSSTTSNTVSNGNKTFTIGTGLSYTPTQNITISYDASNHMHGEVLTYNSGTGVLTVDINNHTGAGTYAAWVVNVGGVTPATSVAWGAITGTLSSQTDLQSALDLKLAATTAASTYYLQTNPDGFITSSALTGYATETFVTTQGYITQGTADGLYYPLSGNPSGFITAGYLTTYAELAGAAFTGPVSTSDTVTVGIFNPDPTPTANGQIWYNQLLGVLRYYDGTSTKSVASQAWASAAFYPIGNPSGFLVAADITGKANLASPTFTGVPLSTTAAADTNTTQIATTAFVVGQAGSATPIVDGTAAVGTSLRYARQDHVHGTDTTRAPLASPTFTGTVTIPAGASIDGYATTASLATYAPLASPTFTGTPTLPTGTIATTQSPGNNTTAVATTAFVTAAVPAFATSAQSRQGTSSTTAQNPLGDLWQMMNPGFIPINRGYLNYTATGTMGTAQIAGFTSRMTMGTAGAASGSFRTFGSSQVDQSYICVSKGYRSYIDFSRVTWCSGRFYTEDTWTDPQVSAGFYFGKANNSANGDLARKGFGWRIYGNATAGSRTAILQVHNGTTLTNVSTTFALVAQQYFDWDVVSLGNGTVTLYINGTQVATTALGPTGDTSYSGTAPVIWNEEFVSTGTTAGYNATFCRGLLYIAP